MTRSIRIAPQHPGVFVKELLDELDISQNRAAKDLRLSAMRISHVVNGQRPITGDLALRLAAYFGQAAEYWMNLQARYDLETARDAMSPKDLRSIRRQPQESKTSTALHA